MPKRFVVDLLPALEGDCLWVEWGDDDSDESGRMLVDGGRGSQRSLNPRLREVFKQRPTQRSFDLIVNTHLDADHIAGLIGLLRDPPDGFTVDEVWFNGLGQIPEELLPPEEEDTLSPAQSDSLERVLNVLDHDCAVRWNDKTSIAVNGAVHVPEPPPRPQTMGNEEPGGDVAAVEGLPSIAIAGLTITLLSPTPDKLAAVADVWETERVAAARAARQATREDEADDGDRPAGGKSAGGRIGLDDSTLGLDEELPEDDWEDDDTLGFNEDTGADPKTLAERLYEPDNSAANGSSIAFIAEYGGKRVLLAGDAHAEVLQRTLRRFQPDGPIYFDAVKLAHHGSEKNLSPDLLAMLDCPVWLISTNGSRHHHPDRRAMARLITRGEPTTLVFNYASRMNEEWASDDLMRDYNYTAYRPPSDEPSDRGTRFDMMTGQAGPLPREQ